MAWDTLSDPATLLLDEVTPRFDPVTGEPVGASGKVEPVAAGSEVAVTGDERVWVVTIGSVEAAATCLSHPATVDLSSGEQPTAGDDVIVGTDGADVIAARRKRSGLLAGRRRHRDGWSGS